ncbi:hypothetical protein A3G55_04645 [Candidatus Giovannonibacteria bacterium RIFCSPLOWO2_12_FULL_44_25]|uniref:Uncharacterized protein n=1 Tax=Candidatus Giovannonibacteria bacterium RIFCSPHIGHO2_02_FULL_45_40 TaxID=1798337 RepID=A0A1F5WAC3_9BACT|nr:MAG: hypothetical protein A2656_03505 [Candidatus Giovannonibacteria bacterium RIFCSPHIGHO2_01_FULL_44_100]OGF72573.1 MAG: hypothetical protein A3C05_02680 [Candidatus Giovannonibacteria bacterium RIFCSPHIGHO2_02_FULL_45_40]OGF83414.1 MAG: hypothetical protein A3E63_02855 [Candidatus Giovannonibacteria bacterium RIFCSPHIGHO2_12_FULL_45_19]OGF84774.1 MAG: hypothetical protein A3A19_03410 [Candidatus Giovannonibacteria bacterium RIFCSPLOWO2_01_FULL_45_140]OGF94141.1 MAG: hypothetical protein A
MKGKDRKEEGVAKKADKKTKLDELWEKVEAARERFDEAKMAKNLTYNLWQKDEDKLRAAGEKLNEALQELYDHEKKLSQKEEL